MAPFDRPYTTFYWSAIVTIALSGTVFELFDVEWYRDFEIWVRGHSRSFNPVPFGSLGAVSYSPSIVTIAVSLPVYEIFSVKVLRDLENWVRCCSRSLKRTPFDRPYTTFYWSAIVNIALSGTVLSYLTLNNRDLEKVTEDHSNWYTIRKLGCGFLFAFHSNVCILHHLQDKVRYWSKIVIFSYHPCIWRLRF